MGELVIVKYKIVCPNCNYSYSLSVRETQTIDICPICGKVINLKQEVPKGD